MLQKEKFFKERLVTMVGRYYTVPVVQIFSDYCSYCETKLMSVPVPSFGTGRTNLVPFFLDTS